MEKFLWDLKTKTWDWVKRHKLQILKEMIELAKAFSEAEEGLKKEWGLRDSTSPAASTQETSRRFQGGDKALRPIKDLCYHCGKAGHYSMFCQASVRGGSQIIGSPNSQGSKD